MASAPDPRGDEAAPATGALGAIRAHLGFAFLFTAAINILFLASPLYMTQLYGRVLNSRSIETLVSLSLVLALALVAMAAADAARGRLLARAGARIAHRLVAPAAARALAEGKGGVGAAVEDVDQIRGFLGSGAAATLMDTPFTILFLFVLFLLHPMLGFVATLGAAAILATVCAARLIEARRERVLAELARANARLAEGLGGDRGEIRALGLDQGLAARLAAGHAEASHARLGMGELSASVGAMARFCRLAAHSAALATGAVLAIGGDLLPSAMLAAAILAGRALGPIEALPGALRQAGRARQSFARLETRLATPRPASARAPRAPGATVEVRRLVAMPAGASRAALRSISFTLAPGETISVAGSTGAGKSTLLRCLAGAEAPRSGELRIDGIDMASAGPAAFAGRVGWLPQDAPLYPGTLRDNIARFGPAPEAEILRAARRAGALAAIERLPRGLDTLVEPGAATLSPNLRQSVAFARALMGEPGLVLLDQPTAHMDAEGEVAALNAIRELGRDGVTVVIVSHKPVLATLADRVMLIEDGAIAVFESRDVVLNAVRHQSLRAVRPAAAPTGTSNARTAL